jgi:hypothetical protein
MFLSPGHPARPHRFFPLNPIVWTPVRGLSSFSPEHDGSASRSCRRKKDGRRRTRTCARAYEWIHHIHHCPRSTVFGAWSMYISVYIYIVTYERAIGTDGRAINACSIAKQFDERNLLRRFLRRDRSGKYFYRSIFMWTWFHSRTICFSKSMTLTHICICVLRSNRHFFKEKDANLAYKVVLDVRFDNELANHEF